MFQANPKHYDIDGALLTGRVIRWSLRQHAKDVEPGDGALIWRSNPDRGIVAVGEVIAVHQWAPELLEREREFLRDDGEWIDSHSPVADLCVRRVELVRGDELKHHPELAGLLVLRCPNRTVFRVNDEEWAALHHLPLVDRPVH